MACFLPKFALAKQSGTRNQSRRWSDKRRYNTRSSVIWLPW